MSQQTSSKPTLHEVKQQPAQPDVSVERLLRGFLRELIKEQQDKE